MMLQKEIRLPIHTMERLNNVGIKTKALHDKIRLYVIIQALRISFLEQGSTIIWISVRNAELHGFLGCY